MTNRLASALLVITVCVACGEAAAPAGSAGSGGRVVGSGGVRAIGTGGGGTAGRDAEIPPEVAGAELAAEVGAMDAMPELASEAGPVADAAPVADVGVVETAPEVAPAQQLPPQGKRALDAWLAEGHYKRWSCEVRVMDPRPRGVHGRNRVCSNELHSRHGAGPYPVGAASVKEIYYGTRIGNYAVAIKVKEGAGGGTWYWYEPGDLEGVGVAGCTGCHGLADQYGGHDYVFVQVKR